MVYPKLFKKAIKGVVGGRALNKKGDVEEFLLKGDPKRVDLDTITVEIRNEEEEKFFRKANKATLINGYLIEISDTEITFDTVNAVSDGYLLDLLKKPLSKMKSDVSKFTSPVPLSRLLEFALENNKPVKTIEYIKSVISSLEGNKKPITKIEDGNIRAGTT